MSLIEQTLKNLPNKPGVYRFYDLSNYLLYIGKAKNLRHRVRSYFQKGSNLVQTRGQRIDLMVSQIDRIDYTVVENEKESLILEANLINSLQPKYNVSLKDDKSYVYVRISLRDEIPGVFLSRQKFDPKSVYFGPFTKRTGILDIIRTIRQIFPFCQERETKGKPCSYVSLHLCEGICAGLEDKNQYLQKIEQITRVLNGNIKEVEQFIQNKMNEAVKNENFALAGLWRDRLFTLKDTIFDQKVVLSEPLNLDLITLVLQRNDDGAVFGSLFYQAIRDGKVNNVLNYILTGTGEPDKLDLSQDSDYENGLEIEFILKFLINFYSKTSDLSQGIYIQVFWRNLDYEIVKYNFLDLEKEIVEQLMPWEGRLKFM